MSRCSTDLDAETVGRHLQRRLDRGATVDQMLTTVRAVQATLLPAHYLLQVDLDVFLAANAQVHTAAARNPETWGRLRAYRFPYRPPARSPPPT